MNKASLGVEVTDNHLKAVLLSGRSLDQIVLENYTILTLPSAVIQDNRIVNFEEFVANLQQLALIFKTNKTVIAGLGQDLTTVQSFIFDETADESLEAVAQFEAAQISAMDDMSFDYQVIDASRPDQQEVLLAVAKQEDVTLYSDAFNGAAMPLDLLDIETYALINAYSQTINQHYLDLENEIFAIFDLGDDNTQAIFIQHGKLLFQQNLPIGGVQLTRDLQRELQISTEEAAQLKIAPVSSEGFSRQNTLFGQTMAMEIQRSLQFFSTTSSLPADAQVKHIFLTGGSSALPGLPEAIQAHVQLPTNVLNPVSAISIGSKVNTANLALEAGRLTIAYGLALRGIE